MGHYTSEENMPRTHEAASRLLVMAGFAGCHPTNTSEIQYRVQGACMDVRRDGLAFQTASSVRHALALVARFRDRAQFWERAVPALAAPGAP